MSAVSFVCLHDYVIVLYSIILPLHCCCPQCVLAECMIMILNILRLSHGRTKCVKLKGMGVDVPQLQTFLLSFLKWSAIEWCHSYFSFLYLIKTTLVQFGRSLNCVRATLFYLSGPASCHRPKNTPCPFGICILYICWLSVWRSKCAFFPVRNGRALSHLVSLFQ